MRKGEKDPYSFTIEYKYDLAGNPVSIKDKRDNTTYVKYDANNRIVEKKIPLEVDGSGNTVYATEAYAYDQVGNIKTKTQTGTKDKASKRETSYTYYDNYAKETILI